MATTKTAARKSVPLSQHDLNLVQRVRQHGTYEAQAFQDLTGTDPHNAPESVVVSTIVHLGCTVLAEKEMEIALAHEAAFVADDPECQEWTRVMRGSVHEPFMADEEAA